jgi:glycosyltransferase involved in cell wall biosynthesis
VVASDQVTPREVGGDLAFYADPTDAHAIAAAIERALASRLDPTLTARRLAAAEPFTWDRAAEQMLAIYESAMTVPGASIRRSPGAR